MSRGGVDIDRTVVIEDDDPTLVPEEENENVPGGSRITWYQKDGLLETSAPEAPSGLIRQICDKSEGEDSDVAVDRTTVPEETLQSTSTAAIVSRTPSLEEQGGDKLLSMKCDHVFVFSDAGKPIYSRHGNEEDFSSHMGVMQTICSFVHEHFDGDTLKHFSLGIRWCCTFVQRPPLVLVVANKHCRNNTNTVRTHMNSELISCLYEQIVSVFTYTHLKKMFQLRSNFDLRQYLTGTEKLLDNMLYLKSHEPALFLHAVRCLPLPINIRDAVHAAIRDAANQMKIKDLVFGVLLARNQLVALVCRKKYKLHANDLHLLINLVDCNSSSFRNAQHTWTPICLPNFDNTGFLHAHISFLTPESDACLLLLTVDRGAFYTLSEMKTKIVERLTKNQHIKGLNEACNASSSAISLSRIGIPLLWHFIYKNRSLSQLCVSAFEPPFVEPLQREKLMYAYRLEWKIPNYQQVVIDVFSGCRDPNDQDAQPLRILYQPAHQHTILSWTTPNFMLISVFNPLVSRQNIITKIDKLLKWLKREEDRLFILSSPTFS